MSALTEWFDGRGQDEPEQRPTVLPLLIWIGIIGCVGWLFHYIAGHA